MKQIKKNIVQLIDTDQPLEDSVVAADLAKPLAQLRPEEREALFLYVVEGYTERKKLPI